jgi:hypothetical protein
MDKLEKKFVEGIVDAEKLLQNSDHLINVTLPVVKDPKLLSRALEDIFQAAIKIVSLILQFEYLHKRILLNSNPEKNLQVFMEKCAEKYGLANGEINALKNLMEIRKKHKESGFEFSKSGKLIILDDLGNYNELNSESIKEFLKINIKLIGNLKIALHGYSERYK